MIRVAGGPARRCRTEQGTVLITVILMVAIAALIASDIAYRQKMDVLRTSAFLSRDSAFQYLLAAESLGIYALKKDQKADDDKNKRNPQVEVSDHLGEDWTKKGIYPIPSGVGIIEGNLSDLQGRFNINSLMAENPADRQFYQSAFTQMMGTILSANPELFPDNTTAEMLKQRVVDWLDIDTEPTPLDGREDDDYLKLEQPYRTANQFMMDSSELLLIEGFTPAAVEFLEREQYVAFLPPDSKINMFTARAEILVAFGFNAGAVADFTQNQRPKRLGDDLENGENAYNTAADLVSFLSTGTSPAQGAPPVPVPGAPPAPTPVPGDPPGPGNINPDLFAIKSDYYLLKGKAVVNDKPVLIESVIWRSALEGPPDPAVQPQPQTQRTVKTIYRKLVDPLKQV